MNRKIFFIFAPIALLLLGCSEKNNHVDINKARVSMPFTKNYEPRSSLVQNFNTFQTLLKEESSSPKLNNTIQSLASSCLRTDKEHTLKSIKDVIEKSKLNTTHLNKLKDISNSNSPQSGEIEQCQSIFETIHSCMVDDSNQDEEKIVCLQVLERIKIDLIRKTRPLVVGAPATHVEINKNGTMKTLYYGTNRKPLDENNHSKGYSDRKDYKLSLGTCDVFIPREHEYGQIDGSTWDKFIHLDNLYGRLTRKTIKHYNSDLDFWEELRAKLNHSKGEKQALIFIHGYNNTFDQSAIRAAQISFDLKFKGATAFYSWPSKGKAWAYTNDEATIQASEKYIKKFLTDFVKKSDASTVHIIAHSMGNRGLLRVINDIQKESKDVKFGQIILAAPDVDADLFKDIAKAYTLIADKTTLYISPRDRAVKASKILHGSARVGFAGPICIADGIETVEVDFDSEPLGHGYFAEKKDLLEDIKALINNDKRKRHLQLRNMENKEYKLIDLK